jgi:hypothetical protein
MKLTREKEIKRERFGLFVESKKDKRVETNQNELMVWNLLGTLLAQVNA